MGTISLKSSSGKGWFFEFLTVMTRREAEDLNAECTAKKSRSSAFRNGEDTTR